MRVVPKVALSLVSNFVVGAKGTRHRAAVAVWGVKMTVEVPVFIENEVTIDLPANDGGTGGIVAVGTIEVTLPGGRTGIKSTPVGGIEVGALLPPKGNTA